MKQTELTVKVKAMKICNTGLKQQPTIPTAYQIEQLQLQTEVVAFQFGVPLELLGDASTQGWPAGRTGHCPTDR